MAQAIAFRAFGALIEAADLVTEMTEVKHQFQAGLERKEGLGSEALHLTHGVADNSVLITVSEDVI